MKSKPSGTARFCKLEPYLAQACCGSIEINPATLGFSPLSLVTALNHARRLYRSGEQTSQLIPLGFDLGSLKIRVLENGAVQLTPPVNKSQTVQEPQSSVERFAYPSPEAEQALQRAAQDKDWLAKSTVLLVCTEDTLDEAFAAANQVCTAILDKTKMQVMLA